MSRRALLAGEIDMYPEYTGNAVYLNEQGSNLMFHYRRVS